LRGGDALTPNSCYSHPLSYSWLAHHEPNLGLYSLLRMRAVDRYGSSNRRSNRLYCSRCCPSPKPQMGMMYDIDRFWQKNKMLLCQSCSKSSDRSSRLNTGILHFGIWNFHCMGLGWIAPSQPVLGSKFIYPIRERECIISGQKTHLKTIPFDYLRCLNTCQCFARILLQNMLKSL
jgi:hypothetical protein